MCNFTLQENRESSVTSSWSMEMSLTLTRSSISTKSFTSTEIFSNGIKKENWLKAKGDSWFSYNSRSIKTIKEKSESVISRRHGEFSDGTDQVFLKVKNWRVYGHEPWYPILLYLVVPQSVLCNIEKSFRYLRS